MSPTRHAVILQRNRGEYAEDKTMLTQQAYLAVSRGQEQRRVVPALAKTRIRAAPGSSTPYQRVTNISERLLANGDLH